jgi:hypothetical protein
MSNSIFANKLFFNDVTLTFFNIPYYLFEIFCHSYSASNSKTNFAVYISGMFPCLITSSLSFYIDNASALFPR